MKKEQIVFYDEDKRIITACAWLPESEPTAVIGIVHGMTEHIGRYEDFASALNRENIAVFGFDLPGHGINLSGSCASFGEGGWQAGIRQIHGMCMAIREKYRSIPLFLLGFSLGSFMVREYINAYPGAVDGAVVMGTGNQPGVVLSAMCAIVKGQIKKNGFDNTTPLVEKLSFETYNKNFSPNRTQSDWLCSDNKELDRYIADPLCRQSISSGLFFQLLTAMKNTGTAQAYSKADKKMPVLLISGKDDPVGNGGKGVQQAYDIMKKAGMENITISLYPGARHDLLHEKSGGQVEKATVEIISWIKRNI